MPVSSYSAAHARRILIDLALKRCRPGAGSSIDFLRMRTAWMRFPVLNSTLANIAWAAVGAAATRLYMPERTTNDLDILILQEDSAEVRARLTQAGAVCQGDLSIGGTTWRLSDGFTLDVIESRDAWVREALLEARTNLDQQQMPVLPMRFLVLMKFQAGRVQDLADIARMLGQASDDDLGRVRDTFNRWLPTDRDDLESIISLGQLEVQSADHP